MIPLLWQFRMKKAYTAWDRSTAYGCNLRDVTYNQEAQEQLKKEWDSVREEFNEFCKKNPE